MPCYEPTQADHDRVALKEVSRERDRMGNLLCKLGKAYDCGAMAFLRPRAEPSLFGSSEQFIAQEFQAWWEEHKKRDVRENK